jgi:pimeloyl-ACP methyl ester carboxylesterase
VAIINFRGHGRSKPFTLNPLNFLVQTFFDVNTKTRLGHHEEFDAYTVVEWLRNQQGYDNVIGMGVCYGTLIFSKAQGLHERACRAGIRSGRLFDKLILDSAWISLKNFCEKLGNDPKLIVTPQKGGWSELWPCKKGFFKNFFPALIKNAIGIQVDDRTVLPYLSDIHQAPILFWYGKDDLTVTRNEFERIWHATGHTHKVAVITSNPHVINHIKQKEAYALINELFIEMNQSMFLNALTDPTIIAHYLATKKHHVFDACTRSLEEPAPAQPARPAPYEQSRLQRATKIGGVGALAAGAALAAANHRHLREQLGNALKNIAGKIIPS